MILLPQNFILYMSMCPVGIIVPICQVSMALLHIDALEHNIVYISLYCSRLRHIASFFYLQLHLHRLFLVDQYNTRLPSF